MTVKRRRAPLQHDDGEWHLDKRVPIALIVTLFLQAAAVLTWANGISSDVASVQSDIVEMKAESKSRLAKFEQVVQLDERLKFLAESIARLERTVERVVYDARQHQPQRPYYARQETPQDVPVPQRRR